MLKLKYLFSTWSQDGEKYMAKGLWTHRYSKTLFVKLLLLLHQWAA